MTSSLGLLHRPQGRGLSDACHNGPYEAIEDGTCLAQKTETVSGGYWVIRAGLPAMDVRFFLTEGL
jgi:hypothetical protein